jgi:hypothetical protein
VAPASRTSKAVRGKPIGRFCSFLPKICMLQRRRAWMAGPTLGLSLIFLPFGASEVQRSNDNSSKMSESRCPRFVDHRMKQLSAGPLNEFVPPPLCPHTCSVHQHSTTGQLSTPVLPGQWRLCATPWHDGLFQRTKATRSTLQSKA